MTRAEYVSAVRAVAAKEIFECLTHGTFVLWLAVCLVLVPTSLVLSYRTWRAEASEYDRALASARLVLEANTNWATLASSGIRVYRPPSLFGALASGATVSAGRSAVISLGRFPRLDGSRADANPLYGVFGALDLSYLFRVIGSLFALLFTYDTLSGEKERGLLRLICACPVSRDAVMAGKLLGRLAALLAPLVVPLLLAAIVLPLVAPVRLDPRDAPVAAAFACALVLYIVVFALLGVAISAFTTRAFESLVAAVAAWLTLVILVPQAAHLAAVTWYAAPSLADGEERKLQAMNASFAAARAEQTRYMLEHPPRLTSTEAYEHWMTDMREWARRLQERTLAEVERAEAKINEVQDAAQARQVRAAQTMAQVSPASLLAETLTALAGTGVDDRARFLASVRAYNWSFGAYVTAKRFSTNEAMNLLSGDGRLRLDGFPRFEHPASVDVPVGTIARNLFLLALQDLALFALGYLRFVRYDVR